MKQWILVLTLLLGLPFLGAYFFDPSFDFSRIYTPYAINIRSESVLLPPPFSWKISLAVALFGVSLMGAFLYKCHLNNTRELSKTERRTSKKIFPWWGWLALGFLFTLWYAAWARPLNSIVARQLNFTLLWASYIAVVNAWTYCRTGTCLLIDRKGYLLNLYLFSIPFWWYFEYLNRFTLNWYYLVPEDFHPVHYIFFGSLAFGTVLPAVISTRDLVLSYSVIDPGFDDLPKITFPRNQFDAFAALIAASACLIFLGVFPLQLYPFLWIAPLFLLTSLQALWNEKHIFRHMAKGRYSILAASAISALICGIMWETWNFYSVPKWIYWVPWVGKFKIYEMPILGFLGYLPFGLECLAMGEIVESRNNRKGE